MDTRRTQTYERSFILIEISKSWAFQNKQFYEMIQDALFGKIKGMFNCSRKDRNERGLLPESFPRWTMIG